MTREDWQRLASAAGSDDRSEQWAELSRRFTEHVAQDEGFARLRESLEGFSQELNRDLASRMTEVFEQAGVEAKAAEIGSKILENFDPGSWSWESVSATADALTPIGRSGLTDIADAAAQDLQAELGQGAADLEPLSIARAALLAQIVVAAMMAALASWTDVELSTRDQMNAQLAIVLLASVAAWRSAGG